jgi:hypothetical protein
MPGQNRTPNLSHHTVSEVYNGTKFRVKAEEMKW